jgi:hypothetical protein
MTIEIKLVTSDQERAEIYSFRYSIYIEEMGRLQYYADRENKRICEPLDNNASLFAAYDNGEIVGTLRTNFSRDSDLDYYPDFYEMNRVGQYYPQRTSIMTKLMIAPKYRKGTLAFRLASIAYANALKARIRYDFIDTKDRLVDFYTRLGYRFHKRGNHPEYHSVTVMIADLEDINHFISIKSPIVKEYNAFMNSQQRGYHLAIESK